MGPLGDFRPSVSSSQQPLAIPPSSASATVVPRARQQEPGRCRCCLSLALPLPDARCLMLPLPDARCPMHRDPAHIALPVVHLFGAASLRCALSARASHCGPRPACPTGFFHATSLVRMAPSRYACPQHSCIPYLHAARALCPRAMHQSNFIYRLTLVGRTSWMFSTPSASSTIAHTTPSATPFSLSSSCSSAPSTACLPT